MLGGYWIPKREALVSSIESNLILAGIANSYNVIVDAPNLYPKTIKKFTEMAKKANVDIEFIPIKIMPIRAYFRILWRTLKGGRYVSYSVVKSYYNRYKLIQL